MYIVCMWHCSWADETLLSMCSCSLAVFPSSSFSSSVFFYCPLIEYLPPSWSISPSPPPPPLFQAHNKPVLVLAAEGNHSECAKVLLRGKADKDATYGDGFCAVHRCVHAYVHACIDVWDTRTVGSVVGGGLSKLCHVTSTPLPNGKACLYNALKTCTYIHTS